MPQLPSSLAFLSLSLVNNCMYFKTPFQKFFYAVFLTSELELITPYKVIPLQYRQIPSLQPIFNRTSLFFFFPDVS